MVDESIIAEIRAYHRERNFAMDQRKRIDLSLGSYLRTQLGWSLDLPKKDADRIKAQAKQIMEVGEKLSAGKTNDKPDDFLPYDEVVFASVSSRAPWDAIEDRATKEMGRLAKTLPIWSWAETIRGFGEVSLAVIVGECGDLANYDGPAKVNKRMGLAVFDGVRQGGLSKNASKDEWIRHGYSRVRRSRMWVIGASLVKGNGDGKYRTMFLNRLSVEHAKAISEGLIPATSQKATVESWENRNLPPLELVKKIDPALHRSAGHMTKRAQRYMEKKFLRDLWCAWNRKPVYENGRPEFESLSVAAE